MKLAMMQPYFFPYIGYFQLINTVDKYIFYDNVNFMRHGWVNRNRILLNNQEYLITVPLQKQSHKKKIYEIMIDDSQPWRRKLIKSIKLSYKNAPMFQEIFPLIIDMIEYNTSNLSEFNKHSIKEICNYLNITTEIIFDREKYLLVESYLLNLNQENINSQTIQRDLDTKTERIIKICGLECADTYINAIGGQQLYSKNVFEKHNIKLLFLKTLPITYQQFGSSFFPWLSMIDVLMFNSIEEIKNTLNQYELL